MADAPGGGSQWGAFEVILAILLAIGLLTNIQNNGKGAKPVPITGTKQETVRTPDNSENRCGLAVSSPLSLQKVSDSVQLRGVVSGCNWKVNGSTALFAQVINGAGVPVSSFVSVQNNGSDIIDTAFDTTIPLTGTHTGTGYLILVPATQSEGKSISVRIPIQFVRN